MTGQAILSARHFWQADINFMSEPYSCSQHMGLLKSSLQVVGSVRVV